MKRYDIKVINENSKEICIVFSISYLSPLKFIKNIENELVNLIGEESDILFDFFLSSGNTPERFARVRFNGNSFDNDSFEYIKVEKGHSLRILSAQYYRDSNSDLDFSFINSVQRKMITRGIAI